MGTKATKMEGTYLPDTPTLNRLRLAGAATAAQRSTIAISMSPCRENIATLDPRSPNICRTPLNILPAEPQICQMQQTGNENAFAQLRKRLLKGFSLNDPRSPQLNRTPLVLDEAIDRTLNMDDTFADLFVETRAPVAQSEVATERHNNSSVEIVSLPYEQEETMPCDMLLHQRTPEQPHIQDPRSPTIGVERTPIIFCDDDESEARETQMLEDILETLTLNLSNGSSMASFVSASEEPIPDDAQAQVQQHSQSQSRPANKHLERVRLGNKRRVAPRKPARANKPQIYVDATPEGVTSTPKSTPNSQQRGQRTPLSCVNKNRMHLRSRSVEKDLRKPQLHSFDDLQLNSSMRILEG
ncbi:uncharacterized protein LOC6576195 [Drosophila mojavensis]|uniref:Uncharacterized protein n=1 Tax=Drosophila mojavensis TaxID=7230 RepID=B4KKI6_DROMO|nr:uncharacterized protein LOC6576195 [Drosophila mojavensis]EDW11636.1 uncharacterized protein Dmoj_GI13947 [Drosophila mojavensis]